MFVDLSDVCLYGRSFDSHHFMVLSTKGGGPFPAGSGFQYGHAVLISHFMCWTSLSPFLPPSLLFDVGIHSG